MSAVRVCSISDAACSRGCGLGQCLNEKTGWPPGMLQDDDRDLSRWLASKPDARINAREAVTTATTGPATVLKLADLEKTMEKLRGMPPRKWMLVSPEGHVWSDEDPMRLAAILAQRKFGFLSAGTTPLGDGEGAKP